MKYLPCALVVLFASTSAADPVSLVTSGIITFTDEPGLMHIAGSGFDVSLGWAPRQVSGTPLGSHCASGCAPTTVIAFGTNTYAFSDFFQGFGTTTVDGVAYSQLFQTGQVTLQGPQIVVPSFTGSNGVTAQGAFTFYANIALFTDASLTGPPVFARELRGRGIATASGEFVQSSQSTLFYFRPGDDLDYVFTSAVPEPGSLGLLGPGLIGIAASRWWRARRNA